MSDSMVQLLGYIISAVVALVVAGIQNNKTTTLLEYRLKQLEDAVNKHNNLVERMTAVETRLKISNKNEV